MITKEKYYSHSGKFTAQSIILALLFGIATALILSFVYAYALYWIPFIYINFFVTIGFGFLVGTSTGQGFYVGKGRNDKIAALLGVIVGLFAYYVSWSAYCFVNFDAFLFLPSSIFKVMSVGFEEGFWSIGRFSGGVNVKGYLLGFFWLLEAIIIVGTTWLLASTYSSSDVYCEKCNKWVSNVEEIDNFEPVTDYALFKNKMENNDYSLLKKLDAPSMKSLFLKLAHCDKCNDLHVLTVEEKSTIKNDKGEEKTSSNILIPNLIVSKSSFEKIKLL